MRQLLPAALVGLLLAGTAQAAEPPLDRAQVEAIVRDLLQREPELVMQALKTLQAKQDAAEAEQSRQAVTANSDALKGTAAEVVANPDGDVTIVEFMDYHCGYCRRTLPALQELVQSDKGVRFVLKEFPILGPDSVTAARAAVASRNQGRYWDMHQGLMASQDISIEGVRAVATSLGLDVAKLEADMASPETEKVLAQDMELARKLGLRGTPAFVVDGQDLVPGAVPLGQLKALVEQARQRG